MRRSKKHDFPLSSNICSNLPQLFHTAITMKVARLYGPRDVRVEEIDEPEPGPRELKIKV